MLAAVRGLLMVTNLMQRYNPICLLFASAPHRQNLLGDFRYGYFENYAGDEGLCPNTGSGTGPRGGIFIEHGVTSSICLRLVWCRQWLRTTLPGRPNSRDIEDQVWQQLNTER